MYRLSFKQFIWTGIFLASQASMSLTWAQAPVIDDMNTTCDKPLASVILIDDQVNTPPWMAEQLRRFQLHSPAQALRKVLLTSGCFLVLDNDPIFWAIPGTAQPEMIFRASILDLSALEKNLGEKASTAVGRYIGSYIGAQDTEIPALQSLTVQVDVLCPKSRRSATRVGARRTSEARTDRPAEQNSALLIDAMSEALSGLVTARQAATLCMESTGLKASP
ncbi:MAG: hypothetical protein SF172_04585 [Burkholderiales bacterium]|jgi:hypothetical protein|nr:hypothetical protein [Burkholderiales bacterium]